ncbi:hypothetical protein MTO96_051233 [Rhipicephalus appendiculatus]
MLELADQFLEAQGGTNLAKVRKDDCEDKKREPDEKKNSQENVTRCFLCNRVGHRASNCRTNDPECFGEDPKIEPSSTQEPRREGAAEGNPVKDASRAQDEAKVRKKVNHEVTVPDEKTRHAGAVATKRPPRPVSEKLTKSVAQTQHRVVPELVKHQQRTNGRDNTLPVSNVSTVAGTPSTKPSSETARRKKNRRNKKRSSEHRKEGRKCD